MSLLEDRTGAVPATPPLAGHWPGQFEVSGSARLRASRGPAPAVARTPPPLPASTGGHRPAPAERHPHRAAAGRSRRSAAATPCPAHTSGRPRTWLVSVTPPPPPAGWRPAPGHRLQARPRRERPAGRTGSWRPPSTDTARHRPADAAGPSHAPPAQARRAPSRTKRYNDSKDLHDDRRRPEPAWREQQPPRRRVEIFVPMQARYGPVPHSTRQPPRTAAPRTGHAEVAAQPWLDPDARERSVRHRSPTSPRHHGRQTARQGRGCPGIAAPRTRPRYPARRRRRRHAAPAPQRPPSTPSRVLERPRSVPAPPGRAPTKTSEAPR